MPLATFAASLALQGQRVSSLSGNIEKIEGFESKILHNKRNVAVYLPPSYKSDVKARFPVVYMQDGQNVFDGMTSFIPNQEWRADEAAEALVGAGIIEPVIIVAIDNGGMARGDEYLPTKTKFGNSEFGGKADQYGKMLTDELMPMINGKYRTKAGPENTGLIGSSLGGVLTSYLGIIHPDVFGRLGVVSPSVWVDNRVLLTMVKPVPRRPRIWIDIGTKEGGDSVRNARDLYEVYVKNGWKPRQDIVLYVEPNAEHNELAWSRRMPSILTYLFPRRRG